jgi:hypothetical protein
VRKNDERYPSPSKGLGRNHISKLGFAFRLVSDFWQFLKADLRRSLEVVFASSFSIVVFFVNSANKMWGVTLIALLSLFRQKSNKPSNKLDKQVTDKRDLRNLEAAHIKLTSAVSDNIVELVSADDFSDLTKDLEEEERIEKIMRDFLSADSGDGFTFRDKAILRSNSPMAGVYEVTSEELENSLPITHFSDEGWFIVQDE